ncbi:MAG: pyridoxal phosphate-dependent aminotransferase [Candidatus Thorarchaeota archaeon]
MFNMVQGRRDVLNMTVGQPDFDTPAYIKEAAKKAIDDGITKYTHNAGLIEVREAMARKLKRENSIDADPETEIMMTAGGMGSLVLANLVLVNPGDEVIYPDPGFVSHHAHVLLAGGRPVPVPLRRENKFSMMAEDVERVITDKTRLLVINSPNNPTGGVTQRKEMERIAELAIEHDFYILADEAYEKFRYDDERPTYMGSLSGMKERCISLFSFSKSYSMTGWRIGFCTGPRDVIAAMVKLQEHVLSMPTSISQKAAEAAVEGPQDSVKMMIDTFRRRRDIITRGLNSIEGVYLDPPAGAFYVFPDVREFGMKSYDLAVEILKQTGVVLVHGSGFGSYGEGFVRLCYAVSTEVIEEAISRLDAFLPRLLRRQGHPT